MDVEECLTRVTTKYLGSPDFNGLSLDDLHWRRKGVVETLQKLVEEDRLTLNFDNRHPNPHILAFQPDSKEEQIKMLKALPKVRPRYRKCGPLKIHLNATPCCAYPSKSHLLRVVDRTIYAARPYTLMLALGEPQLAYRAFNTRVLEFYRNDPRFSYSTDDIGGKISVKSSNALGPPDDTFLETFGFAFNKEMTIRCVAAFLRYLSGMTPEHQRRWELDEYKGDTWLHPDYAKSASGNWSTHGSVFTAFCAELELINRMAVQIRGVQLFRKNFADMKPVGFGFLIRPTLREYQTFVQTLDKMMSDNIDKKFFRGLISLKTRTVKDGMTIEQDKGTITLLSEWLHKHFRSSDHGHLQGLTATFRRVRDERSPLAHSVGEDEWNEELLTKQRELIVEAYTAIRTLRQILGLHPASAGIEVPEWIDEGRIRSF